PGFNGIYWDSPTAYERDRSLFQLYVPLIKTAAQAGWTPVNYATSSDASTLLERFGSPTAGTLYVTPPNPSANPTSVQITSDGAGLGIPATAAVSVVELVSNGARTVTRNGTDIIVSESLDAGQTVDYAVTVSGTPSPLVASLSPASGSAAG